MAITVVDLGWLSLIGFGLFLLARFLKDYTIGIVSGLFLFLFGVYLIINPVAGLVSWFNFVIGSLYFGVGVYVFIVGSIEVLRGYEDG